MRLIEKADLSFVDGMLIEKKTSKVVYMPTLQDEYNEVIDLAELIEFVGANSTEITAAADNDGKPIVFKPTSIDKPCLKTSTVEPATPLRDEAESLVVARAEEFLNVQQYADINEHLKRYPAIARFLAKDYVLIDDDPDLYCSAVFKGNVLELTEAFVVETIEAYHDPAIRKLIASVVIGR
jgi:hypothetical protein